MLRWCLGSFLVVLILTIGAVMYFSWANLRDYGAGRVFEAPVDAIVVLGGGVDGDGVLGYSSRRRVRGAVRLLLAGQARYLIFTGGPEWKPQNFTVAGLMRAHALVLGAPPEALLTESRSFSTFGDLRLGFALAKRRGFENLAILTDAFHLERARHLSSYFGQPDVVLVAVAGLEYDGDPNRVWSIVREAMAWWFNLAKVSAREFLAVVGVDVDARRELIR